MREKNKGTKRGPAMKNLMVTQHTSKGEISLHTAPRGGRRVSEVMGARVMARMMWEVMMVDYRRSGDGFAAWYRATQGALRSAIPRAA